MKRMILGAAAVAAGLTATADVTWWAVPAMSEVQRLPDVVPTDGAPTGTVRIVVAQNEYEPGSFVVRSDRDLGKVRFDVGELKNEKGQVFPPKNLDLKVIKVWYQNRNGWFSYFADDGFKLCPELLLNDEDLIRVDEQKVANYARLVEKDGRMHEWWLNPPRLMNGRYYDHYKDTEAFQFMRENFRDAKTLQPVALPKDVSKQFFLTARVDRDVAPGVYRGEVVGAGVAIPVAIRVLDFELPQPMAYFHPEQEMLISSYSYLGLENVRLYNGGDAELAWRQLEAIFADQVAHGQTMHWLPYGVGSAANERTLDIMRRVGMRTDVLMGLTEFAWQCKDRKMMSAWAQRMADYFDRTLGHHNVYGGYGDEPGCGFFKEQRPVFDSYHAAGLKFVIASQNGILWKSGYNWDWHNASDDAIDSRAPAKWNEMGSDTHCAWYSNMHVGPENPAYNRRQYGLGAWLTGYSAFCNYAHHLGSYNDDSELYKPMVFAYGTYDGVIDTLQWEGFREGVDDIRYGTLLKALATEAGRSDDIDMRHLGRKALLFFASFQRERDDMNMARAEMVSRILALRAALGAKKDVRIVAKKSPATTKKPLPALAEPAPANAAKSLRDTEGIVAAWVNRNDLPSAIAVYESLLTPTASADTTNAVNRAIGGLYSRFYEFEKARQWYLDHGMRLLAASVQGRQDGARRAANRQLVLDVFRDAKESAAERMNAWRRLLAADDEVAFRELDAFAKLRGAKGMADEFLGMLTYHETMLSFMGNWPKINRLLDAVETYDGANTNRVWGFKTSQYAAQARLAVGNAKGAVLYADRALKDAKRSKASAEEIYQLQMMKAVYAAAGDEKKLRAVVAKADAEFGKGVSPQTRKERLNRVGSFAMDAGLETTVRALAAHVDALVKPMPTLTYTIRYSDRGVQGIGGWGALSSKPEVAKMARPFGGSMDFIETDVSTGNRGDVQKDNSKTYERAPEWQAAFDDWGVHFRVEIFDEKAREIEAGALGAGSIEGYLAPGDNTPYLCFLHDVKPGGFSIWNTEYDNPGHRRIDPKDRVNCREEMAYTDNSIILYWGFSWAKFATRVPTDGATWDFEPCLWGRKANATWNGLRTVHGRSSWGKIKFEMPASARARILRKRLVAAKAAFGAERSSEGMHEGVIEHWWDAEVGDRAFFNASLGTFVGRLESESKAIGLKTSDEDVFKLEKTTLDDLVDFRFRAEALRADYLLKQLVGDDK